MRLALLLLCGCVPHSVSLTPTVSDIGGDESYGAALSVGWQILPVPIVATDMRGRELPAPAVVDVGSLQDEVRRLREMVEMLTKEKR